MKYFVALVLALLTVAAHAQTDPACTPFFIESGHIIVQVRVNGHGPYPMLLDTGAEVSTIDSSIASNAKIKLLSPIGFHGIGGGDSTGNMARADMVFEGSSVANLPVVVYPLNRDKDGWVGVLGYNFLSHYNLSINNERSCVSLLMIQ
jgi:hypothetical protein